MSKILSIETATSVCSVAITNAQQVIDILEIQEQNAHSSQLTVLIERILEKNNLKISDFDAIAISKGPGSYTGLRIGTSVAKGLCYASNLPLITIDTLQALALRCKHTLNLLPANSVIMPMIDARRMEVYTSQWDSDITCLQETNALIVDEQSHNQFNSEKQYYICGDGSDKCKSLLIQTNITFVPNITATASTIGLLADSHYNSKIFADVAYFEPFYLKEFQTTVPKNKVL